MDVQGSPAVRFARAAGLCRVVLELGLSSLCVSTFFIALGLSLVGGLGGLLVASGVLLVKDSARSKLVPWLVSYAVGALLGVSMLALLPDDARAAAAAARVRDAARRHPAVLRARKAGALAPLPHPRLRGARGSVFPVLIGDAFHNFVDGAVIAAAVMTSVPLGVSTAVAVAAHEIPQEVGDFAILLHAGYSRSRALLLNVLSAAASAVGAVAAFFALRHAFRGCCRTSWRSRRRAFSTSRWPT